MNVDTDDGRIGYLLGRLFAVIEHAQLRRAGMYADDGHRFKGASASVS